MPVTADAIRATLASHKLLTFAGDETYLLYIQGFPLREFCAFEVFDDEPAWRRMQDELLRPIADAAAANGLGLLAGSLVWRASADYVARLGAGDPAAINRRAVERTRAFIDEWRAGNPAARACPVVVTGDIGPRGDGYAVSGPVSAAAAYDYHAPQIQTLAGAGVDLMLPLTMTSLPETVGIVRAAARAGLPVMVSPTIEPDGCLPDGTPLGDFIAGVDQQTSGTPVAYMVLPLTITSVPEPVGIVRAAGRAGLPVMVSPTIEPDGRLPDGTPLGEFIAGVDEQTSGAPIAYMVNCVHPSHLAPVLRAAADAGAPWLARFIGMRANASAKTHAELDDSTALDRGDPAALGQGVADLQRAYDLRIVGGCCGTDAEHLACIAAACR